MDLVCSTTTITTLTHLGSLNLCLPRSALPLSTSQRAKHHGLVASDRLQYLLRLMDEGLMTIQQAIVIHMAMVIAVAKATVTLTAIIRVNDMACYATERAT